MTAKQSSENNQCVERDTLRMYHKINPFKSNKQNVTQTFFKNKTRSLVGNRDDHYYCCCRT